MPTAAQERYSYAFTRIAESIEKEFYLEAIAIQESIVSDRLDSFLLKNNYASLGQLSHKAKAAKGQKVYKTLAAKIEFCRRMVCKERAKWDEFEELSIKLQKWRDGRNQALHGVVSVTVEKGGKGTNSRLEIVISKANKIATDGEELAHGVNNWRNSQTARKAYRTRQANQRLE
jgi:hypothetical protein